MLTYQPKVKNVESQLITKIEDNVRVNFKRTFGLKSTPDARQLISKFILLKQLENRQVVTKIGKITRKLMAHYKRDKIERQDFVAAIVLYYLSDRKQDIANLQEKIRLIDQTFNLTAIINSLEFSGFVVKEEDYYKINVEALFNS